nr:DNA-directed RNA polymerase subunit beta' [Tanacetum cinerariifolium]
MRSIISMVSISLEGFLPSILLLVVIIVVVVIVAVMLVVVVIDAIVGVVIIVASLGVVFIVMIIGIVVIVDGGVSHIIKLLFVIIGKITVVILVRYICLRRKENEPTSYREAVTSLEGNQWKEDIKSEIDSILQNHTWELVDLPPGCKPLGYKWIFKKKMKADGTIDKYKARLVINGYRQRECLDYFDTYSPVTRITSI